MIDLNKKIICQSCAMPLKALEDFGTNSDKSKSNEYCRFCFQNGKFTDPGITLQEKIDNLTNIGVKQLGMPIELARKMAQTKLPSLKRWKH